MLNIQLAERPSSEQEGGRELSRDEIVKALEDEIITAKLQPGERLDERALALRFGVSRAPVRDAIGRLASLGLIDVRPRSGSYVMSLSAAEVFELFEVMSGLEGLCAYHAAQRLEFEEQVELRQSAEECAVAADTSPEDYMVANLAFHNLVYRGTKNGSLERLTRQARQRVSAYRNYTLRLPGRLKRSAEEHFEIAAAICSGEADRAQRLMADHADIKRADFAQFISRLDTQPARAAAGEGRA
ncbi:GntR family transcriptional regulator [Enterovirga sp. CN4-39]|uniref:GntR family transcriptional regulator n=1 Tax=Enterovirga sp. CN4-39 TaxID=3400910 RepID=UPI003C0E2AF8